MTFAVYEFPYPAPELAARFPFEPLDFRRYPPDEMERRAESFRDEMGRRRSVRMLSDEPVPRRLIEIAVETNTTDLGAERDTLGDDGDVLVLGFRESGSPVCDVHHRTEFDTERAEFDAPRGDLGDWILCLRIGSSHR